MSDCKSRADDFDGITIPEQRPVAVYRTGDGQVVIRQKGSCQGCVSEVSLSHHWIPVLMDRLEMLYAASFSEG